MSHRIDWRHFPWTDREWTGAGLEETVFCDFAGGEEE